MVKKENLKVEYGTSNRYEISSPKLAFKLKVEKIKAEINQKRKIMVII
jgi:hypothetical protein